MEQPKKPQPAKTIEKVLGEALELHEKGVSLHSIVRTYPEFAEEIEGAFKAMSVMSTWKESMRVPEAGLEKILRALPETAPGNAKPVQSPFVRFWSTIHYTNLKYVLPIAAVAFLTGGLIISKKGTPPIEVPQSAVMNNQTNSAVTRPMAATTAPSAGEAPLAMNATPASSVDQAVAAFQAASAKESSTAESNNEKSIATADSQAITDPTQTYGN